MTSRKLKILQVHGWWKVERPGGVITMMKTLATALEERGHEVSFLINSWDALEVTPDEYEGQPFFRLRMMAPRESIRDVRGSLTWLLGIRRTMRELTRFVEAQQIDVVHLHLASPYQSYFRWLHERGGPPYILTLHRGDVLGFPEMSVSHQRLLTRLVEGAQVRVAVSQWLAREAQVITDSPIDTIHNALSPADFSLLGDLSLPAQLADRLPDRYAIQLANLHPYKAQDIAIKAWQSIAEADPDLHLVLMGSGEIETELRQMVQQLGLESRIHFLGHVSRPDALRAAARAMCLIAPSRSEGLPYMALEAGLVGRPMVSSDIDPYLEVVEPEEDALVVPVDDADALAAAIIRLNSDSALQQRLADSMAQNVQSNFLAPVMAERYEKAYLNALAASPK